MSYFMKKSSDTKSKEFKVKIINEEHMKLTKYFYNVLTITDICQMTGFVSWFIFIKIVSQTVKRLKKILIIEKDCNDWKRL